MKQIAVFCGSSRGTNPVYRSAAHDLGIYLSRMDIDIVFGGGHVGLMGVIADAALSAGGKVYGVIPDFLHVKELAHTGVTELISTDSMHSRKKRMYELSDGFIILPGGFGTLDELFEITTWAQLGRHSKPIGILNIHGYFDPLLEMIERMVSTGFLKRENAQIILHDRSSEELLDKMTSYEAYPIKKWMPEE